MPIIFSHIKRMYKTFGNSRGFEKFFLFLSNIDFLIQNFNNDGKQSTST